MIQGSFDLGSLEEKPVSVFVRKAHWYRSWLWVGLIAPVAVSIFLLAEGIAASVWPPNLEWDTSRPFILLPEKLRSVDEITVAPDGTVYVVSLGTILRQELGSESWDICSAPIHQDVETVFVDQLHDQLLAGTRNGVFRSRDGLEWERLGEEVGTYFNPVKVSSLDQRGTLYVST